MPASHYCSFRDTEKDQRIRDLEREVERLKSEVAVEKAISGKMRVYDTGATLADTTHEADRADAERWRAMRKWVDSDHAKEGEAK